MKKTLTPQEKFWAGTFGDEYIKRNKLVDLLPSSLAMFSEILKHTGSVKSVLEFGANIGTNLRAIEYLLHEEDISAIEINAKAVGYLKKQNIKHIYHTSLFDYQIDYQRDFVFTRCVLIHLNPDKIIDAYKKIYESSKRYICIAEYYNPTPVSVVYRGNNDRLYKRDFAGEMLDLYPDLKLISYGFGYHRDVHFPLDDINWFLLEKIDNG